MTPYAVPPSPPVDPKTLARTILSDTRRYQLTRPHAVPHAESWLERVLDWVNGFWERLIRALAAHVHVSKGAGLTIGHVVLALFAVAFVVLAARLLAPLLSGTGSAAAPGGATETSPDANALYRSSLDAAARGDLARAAALLFASAVAALDLRGVVREDAGTTVGEFRRELRARDARLLPAFDEIARPFTAAAYAERRITREEWEGGRRALLALLPAEQSKRA